jgi:hypothetical protein
MVATGIINPEGQPTEKVAATTETFVAGKK